MGFEDDYGGNELDPKMWDSDNDWLVCCDNNQLISWILDRIKFISYSLFIISNSMQNITVTLIEQL